jgi:hypothetical protein
MEDVARWFEIAGRLIGPVASLAHALWKAGDPDPESTIRKDILDRRALIEAKREQRDRDLDEKHDRDLDEKHGRGLDEDPQP